jgi:hypothetical protein
MKVARAGSPWDRRLIVIVVVCAVAICISTVDVLGSMVQSFDECGEFRP